MQARTRPRSGTFWARRCCRCSPATSATPISPGCAATPCCRNSWGWRRSSARTRCGGPSRRSTRRPAPPGCGVIWRFAWSRCWPSRGSLMSTRRSSRSTAIRKGRSWATIPRSPGVRATATIPMRWLRRVWFSTSRFLPATSTRPSMARQDCGGSSTVCRATCGLRCCAATAVSASRGSCGRRRRGACPISSSCA